MLNDADKLPASDSAATDSAETKAATETKAGAAAKTTVQAAKSPAAASAKASAATLEASASPAVAAVAAPPVGRYVCVHGHFYQPPRENPWLETVEVQDSAAPYHDWNDRITAECYAPNGASRINNKRNQIVRSSITTPG